MYPPKFIEDLLPIQLSDCAKSVVGKKYQSIPRNKIEEINNILLKRNYSFEDISIFWDDCIKIVKNKHKIYIADEFKTSVNGEKLANKLNKKFDLNLLPKIKRNINLGAWSSFSNIRIFWNSHILLFSIIFIVLILFIL